MTPTLDALPPLSTEQPAWIERAECARRGADLKDFYPNRAFQAAPIIEAFCEHCPVVVDCHDYAERHGEQGVWGAMLRVPQTAPGGHRTLTRGELEAGAGRPGQRRRDESAPSCAVCGGPVEVRRDGLVRSHRSGSRDKRVRCDGSGRPPAGSRVAS